MDTLSALLTEPQTIHVAELMNGEPYSQRYLAGAYARAAQSYLLSSFCHLAAPQFSPILPAMCCTQEIDGLDIHAFSRRHRLDRHCQPRARP